MSKNFKMIVFLIVVIIVTGCRPTADDLQEEESVEMMNPAIEVKGEQELLKVDLYDNHGSITGTATIFPVDEHVVIHLNAWNLPEGIHGFHIHEKGDCEQPDFASAGGHFNPTETKHGFYHPEGPHAGDLPNIYVLDNGTVNTFLTTDLVTLLPDEANSLFQKSGTSLVIHEQVDDYKTQPAGDAGERIVCGEIQTKKSLN